MSDLIERLKLARDYYKDGSPVFPLGSEHCKALDEAITALSPVLPDDVAHAVDHCRGRNAVSWYSKNQLADLLERQAQEIRVQEVFATSQRKLVAVQAERIEEIEAQNAKLENDNKDKSQLLASFRSQIKELETAKTQ